MKEASPTAESQRGSVPSPWLLAGPWLLACTVLLTCVLLLASVAHASPRATAEDPVGDTLNDGRPDLVRLLAESSGGVLQVELTFDAPVQAPGSGDGALFGFLDLDTDRNPATGGTPMVDFLTDVETGMGQDMYVDLGTYADGAADLVRASDGSTAARVAMTLLGDRVRVSLPASVLGGGTVHTAAVVGNDTAVTDVVPNGGFLASTGGDSGGDGVLLTGDRFRVEVDWRDFDGGRGAATLAVRSPDSAVFYFFDENNWELMVKVLDACGVNGHFWVFAAATTNLEYTLRITDTANGTVKTYSNPLGTAAAAVTDTGAFATCG
ncbi:MAG: hypothetical protein AAGD06_16340 [Acidobacteriota bacterium]